MFRKSMRLLSGFYREQLPSFLLILCIMTYGIYSMTDLIGVHNFITYSKRIYEDSPLTEAHYFLPAWKADINDAETKELFWPPYNAMLEELTGTDGVRIIRFPTLSAGCELGYVTLMLVGEENVDSFIPRMTEGEWFTADSAGLEGIFAGVSQWDSLAPGDTYPITIDGQTLELTVRGRLTEPSYGPALTENSTTITTDTFLHEYENIIYVRETPELRALAENRAVVAPANFFVDFTDADPDKREELIALMKQHGRLVDREDILAETDRYIEEECRKKLPIPLFAVTISTFSLISISVLTYHKRRYEYSVWFICGCSRRRALMFMTAGMALVNLLSGGLNLALIAVNPYLFRPDSASVNRTNCIIDGRSVGMILLYMAIVMGISLLLAYTSLSAHSPSDLKRRSMK